MRIRKNLIANRSGTSATEFAFIAPVMAFVVLGMIDGWSLADTTLNMRTAAQAGAKYLIGGTWDASAVREVAVSAWPGAPDDVEVSVNKACECAGTASGCQTFCAATSRPPETYYTVAVSGSWTAPFDVDFLSLSRELTQQQVIRVR